MQVKTLALPVHSKCTKVLPQKLGTWVPLRLLVPPAEGKLGLCPLGDILLEFLGHFVGP